MTGPRYTRPRWEDQEPGVCWDCGGPCASNKGSTHGWRCTACLDAYLDEGWARWISLGDKERTKRALATAGGRGGGGLASGRTAGTSPGARR